MIDVKRIFALLALLIVVVRVGFADVLTDFTQSRAINAPMASVLVMDLKNGKQLAAHNVDKPLIPASIMKCVTTATLLEKVGARYRYITPVYITGNVKDSVLEGNLVVEASGDPSVNTGHEPHSEDFVKEIVDAVKALGIKRISGKVIVDENVFTGPSVNPTWASGDLPHAYGTGSHGFNFEDNSSGRSSVKDPSAVFRNRLSGALRSVGVTVGNADVQLHGRRHLLGEHRSATIDEIMRSCMMRSDNQFAEGMLRLVGKEYGKNGSSAEGASRMMEFWKRRHAAMDSVAIYDGSGLSRSNRVTARFMGDVLKRMAKNPYYASFFPLAGQEGTLKRLLAGTPLEGYIAMKTGSMNGIQCYAGYKLDEDYAPTHVVVIMLNGMSDRASARREVEKLLLGTFE